MKTAGNGCLLLFGLVWCGFLGLVDFMVLRELSWDLRSIFFPTADGEVIRSEIKPIKSSSKSSKRKYEPSLTYRYHVDGEERQATARRRGLSFDSTQRGAREVVDRYPAGAPIIVSYDPAHPEQTTYEPGLKPGHLHVALFLVPFHAVGLGILAPLWLRRRGRRLDPILRSEGDLVVRIPMPLLSPFLAGLIALAAAAFIGMFASIPLMPLTLPKILGVWAVVLAIGAFFYRWAKQRQTSGAHDLVIDATTQSVHLPPMDDRTSATTLDFAQIESVQLRHLGTNFSYRSRWGTVTQKGSAPHLELSLITDRSAVYRIARSPDLERLRAIAEKLSETFGWKLVEKTS